MAVLRKTPLREFVPGTPGVPGVPAQTVCVYVPPPGPFPGPPGPPDSGNPPRTCYQMPAVIVCDQVFNPVTGVMESVNCRVVFGEICSG
jgi:hypothetical protein